MFVIKRAFVCSVLAGIAKLFLAMWKTHFRFEGQYFVFDLGCFFPINFQLDTFLPLFFHVVLTRNKPMHSKFISPANHNNFWEMYRMLCLYYVSSVNVFFLIIRIVFDFLCIFIMRHWLSYKRLLKIFQMHISNVISHPYNCNNSKL